MDQLITKVNSLGYLSLPHLIPIIKELQNSSLETQIDFFHEHSSNYKFAPVFDELFLSNTNFRLHPEIGEYYHVLCKKYGADIPVMKMFLDTYPERDINDYRIRDGLVENIDYLIEKSYFFNHGRYFFHSIYKSIPVYCQDITGTNFDTNLRKFFEYISKIKSIEEITTYLDKFIERYIDNRIITTQIKFGSGLNTTLDNCMYHLLMYLHEICCIDLFKIDSLVNHVPMFFSHKMNQTLMYLLDIGLTPEHVSLNIITEDSKFDELRDKMFANNFSDRTIAMIEAIYKLNPNTSRIDTVIADHD